MKILIAMDGSAASLRALKNVLKSRSQQPLPELHLVNVQAAISSDITRFVAASDVHDFHREASEKALMDARHLLDAATTPYTAHALVGEAAPSIAQLAEQLGCEEIHLGRQGAGWLQSLLLGSVSQRVLQLTELPVMLVK